MANIKPKERKDGFRDAAVYKFLAFTDPKQEQTKWNRKTLQQR